MGGTENGYNLLKISIASQYIDRLGLKTTLIFITINYILNTLSSGNNNRKSGCEHEDVYPTLFTMEKY